jgi:hypothetical protein
MTPAELDEIKARVAAATEGPWEAYSASCCPDMGGVSSSKYRVHAAEVGNVGHPALLEDAEFMAHARTDVPALIAALEEAWAALREAADDVEAEGLMHHARRIRKALP